MSTILRTGALALALLAGTALTAAPAMAGHDRHDGWGKKSWKHGYNKHHRHGHYRGRYGYGRYGYYGRYGRYGYGRPYGYWGRPGFSIYID